MSRQLARDEDQSGRLTVVCETCADAEGRLGRLYAAIENGVTDSNVRLSRAVSMPAKPSAISPRSPTRGMSSRRTICFARALAWRTLGRARTGTGNQLASPTFCSVDIHLPASHSQPFHNT